MTEEIKDLIENSHALIAIMTKRDEKTNGNWTTHQWVQEEFNHAKSKNIYAIALIENGVEIQGMYKNNEHIILYPDNQLPAFLKLSATLGFWKKRSGRQVKLLVQPEQIVQNYGESSEWRYRFNIEGEYTEWLNVQLTTEPGGRFLYLPNVSDEALIQVQVKSNINDNSAKSVCCPQWVSVNLEENNNG
ncbi:MAG: hypothetical protein R2792_14890 [Saprospiraceae bacterium]